jgi:hypothetical protein
MATDWYEIDQEVLDIARAITQLHYESSRVGRMEKEIEDLKKKLAHYEPAENGKSEAVEQDIEF